MTSVRIEAGTLTASRAERTVTGLLIPFGELGRTNLGRFAVEPDAFTLPADPSVITLNRQHDPSVPLGRATALTKTTAGVMATFAVAAVPEGDAYLDEVDAGQRNGLSAEVADVVIRAGKGIAGRLFAAAAVVAGAFPSATLLAADVGEIETTEDEEPSADATEVADKESTMDEDETETTEVVEETPTEEEPLKASLPASVTPARTKKAATLLASLTGKAMPQAATLMAALDNITAADALPAQERQWLGEIYGSRTYRRRFANLTQPGTLTALKAIGWRFVEDKTPEVDDYAGFPAQPHSNEVKSESVELTAARLAGAGAVDRAFLDFPTPEFWSGYFREQSNSYERKLDHHARDAYIAGATEVTAGTVPTGVATAAAYIVDGAMAIIEAERDLPAWAIVGSDLYRALLLTRADDLLAYLTIALGIEEGSIEGFRIVPSSVATLASKVLVGTKTSATVYELPGVPIRVDTVAIASGAVERGAFGYHAELINDTKGLALVGPEDEG